MNNDNQIDEEENYMPYVAPIREYSSKSRLVLIVLSFFLGCFGLDRFYGGRIKLGLLKLGFNLIGIGLFWTIFDFILALFGRQRDANYLRIKKF